MLKSHEIGETRIDLAKILSDWCGEHVSPALLARNYESNNYGFANAWWYDGDRDHPLFTVGSAVTMTDFVRYMKKDDYKIVQVENELFIGHKSR